MTRYKLTIEYKGTDYFGWQRQPNVHTIQEEIEKAITAFCGQSVEVVAAGRTDAGVHARGQIAHADLAPLKKPMSPSEICKAINAHLLPRPIQLLDIESTDDNFHARFSAKKKLYVYRILNRHPFLTLDKGLAWHVKRPLNALAMREAAQLLLGERDFTTFRDSDCQAKSPVRTLERLDVQSFETMHGTQEILIEAQAMSFLHHMVRNLAGTLALVGQGKWQPEDVVKALEAKDRKAGGPTAPPDGLYLVRVDYHD